MHQTTITSEQFTGLREHLAVFGHSDTGTATVTVGKHPDLGSIVVTQVADGNLLLWSEHRFAMPDVKPDNLSVAA